MSVFTRWSIYVTHDDPVADIYEKGLKEEDGWKIKTDTVGTLFELTDYYNSEEES